MKEISHKGVRNRLVKVWKRVDWMDGNAVALRNPLFTVDGYDSKDMSNVSSLMWLDEESLLKIFKDECKAWGQLHHRNILPLLGITEDLALVTPWIEYSTLESRIYQNDAISDPYKIVCVNFLVYFYFSTYVRSFLAFMTDYATYIVVCLQWSMANFVP